MHDAAAGRHPARADYDHRAALCVEPLRFLDAVDDVRGIAHRVAFAGCETMLSRVLVENSRHVNRHRAVQIDRNILRYRACRLELRDVVHQSLRAVDRERRYHQHAAAQTCG